MSRTTACPDEVGAAGESHLEERRQVEALRAGDEEAFRLLVERYQAAMVRLARIHVPDRGAAEEVVQEAWLGVLKGIDRFEGRSSLKTWIFRILLNRAKSRGGRERRTLSVFVPPPSGGGEVEPAVDPRWFKPAYDPREPGHWAASPAVWARTPEGDLMSRELLAGLKAALGALPARQREVITLRDVEGCSAAEVCNVLGLSGTNQRVLLHRARSAVRRALEWHFRGA